MQRGPVRLSVAGLLFVLAGCASTALRGARADLAAGNYQAAHQELLAARSVPDLRESQRREIDNDLCVTEYKIGAPAYPLDEQDKACTTAAAEGATTSAELEAKVSERRLTAASKEVNDAITDGQLSAAEEAISRYAAIRGADQAITAKWSDELWSLVKRENEADTKSSRSAYRPAIAQVERRHPEVHRMSQSAFTRWLQKNLTVEGQPLVSHVSFDRRTLTLLLPEDKLDMVALNLDRLALVNDGMVARCGCVGQTNVSLQKTELPAYFVRLDAQTRQSEILVLAQPGAL
jgi:hypothetical protein